MDNVKRLAHLPKEKYQIIFEVHEATIDKMLEILKKANQELRKFGGRPSRLSVLDKLVVMLGYYHDYRTMENIAFDYGVSKSRICDAISWSEQTLIKDGTFSLPSKRELLKADSNISIAIIEVTECETERPKHNQKTSYSGKKNGIQ
jgi:hypothetical protein